MARNQTICMVTSRCPWPPISGAERRVYQHITILRKYFRIVLVTSACGVNGFDFSALRELRQAVDELVIVAPARIDRGNIRQLVRGAPLQVVRGTNMGIAQSLRVAEESNSSVCTYYSLVRTGPYLSGRRSPALLDYCDALSLQFRRKARAQSPPMRGVYRFESTLLKQYERRLGRLVDASCVTSPVDQKYLRPTRTIVVSNAFDMREPVTRTDAETTNFPIDPSIAFTGDMSTAYSEAAATWFAETVLPHIRRAVPDAGFWVIGRDPTAGIRQLAVDHRGVHVTGGVRSVGPLLSKANVAVVPLQYGTGVKNKILEAFSFGVPVVGTSVADDGMWAARSGSLIVADSPIEMAGVIVRLLRSPGLRAELGARGKAFGQTHYSSAAIEDALLFAVDAARRGFSSLPRT